MTSGFAVRALGKGSVASFFKVALDIVWVLLWVGAAALGVAVISYLGVLIAIQAGALDAGSLEPSQGRIEIGPVKVQTDAGERLILPVMVPVFLAAAIAVAGALIIVLRLKRLFKNFTSGEPFSRDNADHLRVIWITMLVMELSRYAIWAVVTAMLAVLGRPETTEIRIESPVNFATWGSIFILIVLAEVFREGARMKEEQELTI